MAASDIQLLSLWANFTLDHTCQVEEKIRVELQTSATTRSLESLRMLRLQRAILAIGMFSLFESLLQESMDWKRPFEDLQVFLLGQKEDVLARDIENYFLAINVLKHGEGRSYKTLLERKGELAFTVKGSDQSFFDEGDVSEVSVLVDANDAFVKRCAEVIQKAAEILRKKMGIWI